MQTRNTTDRKRCHGCRKSKHRSEFWRDPRQTDGRDATCSECRKPQQKAYRSRVAVKNRRARWEATTTQRVKRALRKLTTKLLGKPGRCAVPKCKRNDLGWHHLNGDPREVIALCNRHHKAIEIS
mgnify:CR=1 FL=1